MTAAHDDVLTTLTRSLAPEALDDVRAACGLQGIALNASASHVELLKHARGKRATLLYSFGGQVEAPMRIVGKLYRSGRRAARMQRWLSALDSDVFPQPGRIRMPQPLGLSEKLHMLLYAYIEGVDLRHALHDDEAFVLAARWLARLHDAPPMAELKVRTIEHEVTKSLQWLDLVRPNISAVNDERLARTREQLERLRNAAPRAELRMIHRDYYYANLLWDGSSLWAMDIDQLRLGDPALDVAHFSAHLQVLAYRQTGDFTAYDMQAEQFRTSYSEARPAPGVSDRLPIYNAYTFLKLGATEAERAREGWREAAEAFALHACEELERSR